MSPDYIYDPALIEAALIGRSRLRAAVGDGLLAHRPANFLRARCSSWQIARILGVDTDAGPGVVADELERCLAAGLALRWLRTSSRPQFRSGLAEVRTACELLRHGFAVDDLASNKGQSRVPEFAARDGHLEVAVEVYAPRDWERLSDLAYELRDHILHHGAPMDYDVELTVGPLSRFDDKGGLMLLHPGPVDAGLANNDREGAVASVMEQVGTALSGELADAQATHVVSSLNLNIQALLTGIRGATGSVPQRRWCIHHWPAGGYAIDGMFDGLVRGRVRRKMHRGQASAAGLATSLLVVDLTQFPLAGEWEHDFYDGAFRAALERRIAPDLMGHDAIAFCDASNSGHRLRLRYAVVTDAVSDDLMRLLNKLTQPA